MLEAIAFCIVLFDQHGLRLSFLPDTLESEAVAEIGVDPWGDDFLEKMAVALGAASEGNHTRAINALALAERKVREIPAERIPANVAECAEKYGHLSPIHSPSNGGRTGSFDKTDIETAIMACFNYGSLSMDAREATITVRVLLDQNGYPNAGAIQMISFRDGDETSVNQLFQTARRAIIRCGARGFSLPVESYSDWKELEVTFSLDGVSIGT